MPVSINNTQVVFNDATTQTTAGIVSGGALGTPSSGALTNCTSVPVNQATGTLPVANGGSGQTTYTNGQLLIGNTTGNTLTKATLTQGSGISITNGAGSITIAATGGGSVTSVATGNGLSGGTITTSGTLVIACPSASSVGAYAFGYSGTYPYNYGGDYSGSVIYTALITGGNELRIGSSLPGTWRWLGKDSTNEGSCGIVCRVS